MGVTARVKTKPQLEVLGRSDDLETSFDRWDRVSCVSSLFVYIPRSGTCRDSTDNGDEPGRNISHGQLFMSGPG